MIWRLITDDNVSASFGLAADETIAQRVGSGASPPTLRLYIYRSHCALVGRFQNLENEIHLDYCRSHGIAINRRPTGGAIIMGENQLGVALMIPASGEDTYGRARELMEKFSAGLVWALNQLGVKAQFRRKNDIEVHGRKIAGLGIYRAGNSGLLFHASLLVDLDVPLMLRVLNTPFEKISDKEIATVAARTTTVRREIGHSIALNDVRQKAAEGYSTTFRVELAAGGFTTNELQHIAQLEREKYLTTAWIFQTTDVADATGAAKTKTSGGLLEVKVTLAGRMLKAVFITGDFFAAENAIADLEASLRWHASDSETIAATLQRIYTKRQNELSAIPLQTLIETIQAAVQQALAQVWCAPNAAFRKLAIDAMKERIITLRQRGSFSINSVEKILLEEFAKTLGRPLESGSLTAAEETRSRELAAQMTSAEYLNLHREKGGVAPMDELKISANVFIRATKVLINGRTIRASFRVDDERIAAARFESIPPQNWQKYETALRGMPFSEWQKFLDRFFRVAATIQLFGLNISRN